MAAPFCYLSEPKSLLTVPLSLTDRGSIDCEKDSLICNNGVHLSQEEEKDCGKCNEVGNNSIMVLNSRDIDAPNCPRRWRPDAPASRAVQNNDVVLVQYYVRENPACLALCDKYGRTPFHYACWFGLAVIARILSAALSLTDLLAIDCQGWSALHFACDASCPNMELVRFLLCKLNLNPRQETNKGSTPVSLAAYKGHSEIVRYITDIMLTLSPTEPKHQWPSLVTPGVDKSDSVAYSDHPNGDRNMSRLDNRLFTFTMGTTTWPRAHPTERELAEQGFVYTGLEERVFCFCCKAIIHFWDDGKDPLLKHYEQNSKCQFLLKHFSVQLDRLLALSKTQHAFPDYASNSARLHSFRNWRFSNIVSYFKLASAGFFYTGVSMCTQCFSCGLTYDHWRKGDIPIQVHQRWNPRCEYLQTTATPVPLPAPVPFNALQATMPTLQTFKQPSAQPPIKAHSLVLTKQPDYNNLENRIKSFKLLPKEVPVSAEDCAKTGLFFLRKPDVMQCYTCDAIVRGWVKGDVPSEKHRAISPQCKFLREFFPTKLDHKEACSIDPSSLPEPEFTQEDLAKMSRKESQLSDMSRLSLHHSSYYPPTRLTSVMPSPQESESSGYASRQTLPLSTHSTSYSKSSGYASKQTLPLSTQSTSYSESPGYASKQTLPMSTHSTSYSNESSGYASKQTLPLSTHSTSYSSSNRFPNTQSTSLRIPSTSAQPTRKQPFSLPTLSAEDIRQCVICMDNGLEVVALPCGHLCMCQECARSIDQCPMCRQHIEKTFRVYLP